MLTENVEPRPHVVSVFIPSVDIWPRRAHQMQEHHDDCSLVLCFRLNRENDKHMQEPNQQRLHSSNVTKCLDHWNAGATI